MCGIVGYIGDKNAATILIEGLRSLEYRGYDSAGIAIVDRRKRLFLLKKAGKLKALSDCLINRHVSGHLGIGHTRWATHGEPNEANAHPHYGNTRDFLIVHNGIIENHHELKQQLRKDGHRFSSQTDTEVAAHLVEKFYKGDLLKAVCRAIGCLKGSFALGVICMHEPDVLVAARKDSPLIIGLGKGENFIASDVPAILSRTRDIIYLDNNEIARISKDEVKVFDAKCREIQKKKVRINWNTDSAEKAGFAHFMIKEIEEQPQVIGRILTHRIKSKQVVFENLNLSRAQLKNITDIQIVACGTAYHAGLCGKYILEKMLRIPINVDTSSEFRYREQIITKGRTLIIPVSQSGETADTLASLRAAKEKGAKILSLCNVVGSSIARESDGVIYTLAGPEISVASTKAYTAQLMTFYLLGLYLAGIKKTIADKTVLNYLSKMKKIPALMRDILKNQKRVKKVAHEYVHRYHYRLAEQFKFLEDEIVQFQDPVKALEFAEKWARLSHSAYGRRFGDFPFLYLGRNVNYPSALEGALKLKEITYISAEGYAAGEMKHGPIALIDEFPLVVCIATKSAVYEKMLSNIREIKARKGTVLSIATRGDKEIQKKEYSNYVLEIPEIDEFFSPLLVALPLQMLAYHIAVGLNCDVDQPRNLAKSVTVE
ncbi:MAG: glutamine--fructose-6-phosphate transaminase (isomerizing) [Candidatus Omnitrophica bacterium]|nr:glutamine--fructose-6-phosphate transaminase (isomerizing) [Candidatus Omnitrophota bacterium]